MANIKSIINIQITFENYRLRRSQIMISSWQNGFDEYLDGTMIKPLKQIIREIGNTIANTNYNTWILIKQNLANAIYSIISSNLLSCLKSGLLFEHLANH